MSEAEVGEAGWEISPAVFVRRYLHGECGRNGSSDVSKSGVDRINDAIMD